MAIKLVFLAQVGATLAMAGITWFAQVVHYPLFDHVGRGAFSSWLFRIARNKCFNEIKKKRESLNPDVAETAASIDVEQDLMHKELVRKLDETLQQLPFEQRVVFILAEIQELSYEEIGEIESIPVGTVKSRLSRGRNKVAQLLNQFQE